MNHLLRNNKGQFSIIAALLVAVVIVSTVITTYAAIRYDSVSDQPQVLSAVDETNLALKQLLGFTVGYYGSILQVTGNTSYAQGLARSYLESGLENIADIKPEWGISFNITSINLHIVWFLPTSSSSGSFSVTYDISGLGFYNLTYNSQSSLEVQILNSLNNEASVSVYKEGGEPLTTLATQNFKFYNYNGSEQTWELVSPTSEPVVFANGTYLLNVPSGVNTTAGFLVQVEDSRGIMTVASSFSKYLSALSWSSIFPSANDFVDQISSQFDPTDRGSHGNFTLQKAGPDSQFDTLTEANTGVNTEHYIDQVSDVDGSADKGTHSSFPSEKAGPDSNVDVLTEANSDSHSVSAAGGFMIVGNGAPNWGSASGTISFWVLWNTIGGRPWGQHENMETRFSGSKLVLDWGATGSLTSVTNFVAAKWYFIAITWNQGTDKLSLYVGDQSSSPVLDSSVTSWSSTVSTVGVTQNNFMAAKGGVEPLNGRGDDLRYWNVDRSLAQIQGDFNRQLTGSESNLRSYFKLNNNFVDIGPNNNNGSGSGSFSFSSVVPMNQFELDLEVQFTNVDYNQANEFLCIYARTLGTEPLSVQVRYGSSWVTVINSLNANAWNNVSVSTYLASTPFTIRFNNTVPDATPDTWQIDAVLLHTWTTSYELDLEEQFTNVDYNQANEYLCVYAGNLGPEALKVDVRSGSNWITVIPNLLANQWNNVSVSSYLTSSTFTIRFKGNNDPDTSSDTWQIDTVMLRLTADLNISQLLPDSTFVVEWLQDGTMRWLGEDLQLESSANPIPPISVKAIHLNQTVNGLNQEVPFQVEDWASSYRVPLGLTSNTTVFSNRQMIVFLLNTSIPEFTLWWDGSDLATQTPLAYTNRYFLNDDPANHILNNGKLALNIGIRPGGDSTVESTFGSSSNTAKVMRINGEYAVYGADEAYVIHHGVIRDIVQQEAEWSNGAGTSNDCPNLYANMVLTLPAGTSYYTYQLRVMFTDSTGHSRTISDFCPLQLSSSAGSPTMMTENGTLGIAPIVVNGTGTFASYGSQLEHHWSQYISGQVGAGIMFTDSANLKLYAFDSLAGGATGALNVNATSKTIELAPVTSLRQVASFTTPMDITWRGAVVTFDATTTPIYKLTAGTAIGLWILAEHPPQITVTAER